MQPALDGDDAHCSLRSILRCGKSHHCREGRGPSSCDGRLWPRVTPGQISPRPQLSPSRDRPRTWVTCSGPSEKEIPANVATSERTSQPGPPFILSRYDLADSLGAQFKPPGDLRLIHHFSHPENLLPAAAIKQKLPLRHFAFALSIRLTSRMGMSYHAAICSGDFPLAKSYLY